MSYLAGFIVRLWYLLTEHQEYRDRLEWYEEVGTGGGSRAQMHAAAVALIAVGCTVGVAPGARLYFIGVADSPFGMVQNWSLFARGLRRLLDVNRALPEGRKIRVVSMSTGWSPGMAGYDDIESAVRQAKRGGVSWSHRRLRRTTVFATTASARRLSPTRTAPIPSSRACSGRIISGPLIRAARLLIPMDSRTV